MEDTSVTIVTFTDSDGNILTFEKAQELAAQSQARSRVIWNSMDAALKSEYASAYQATYEAHNPPSKPANA